MRFQTTFKYKRNIYSVFLIVHDSLSLSIKERVKMRERDRKEERLFKKKISIKNKFKFLILFNNFQTQNWM